MNTHVAPVVLPVFVLSFFFLSFFWLDETQIKTYIKAAHPDDTKAFVFQLKAAAQRVSVALQRSTALAILEMNRRAKTYPSLKV